tara:strand:- start:15057 stop:16046 length:990 start_codon:yes stop_codon:yes gene_type:complete
MMRILITGASGFLGFRTIEYLVERSDFYIIAAARTRRDERTIISDRVQYFFGDLMDANYVQSLFKTPIFAVVNCASLSSPWGKKRAFRTANIVTQENLVEVSLKSKVNRFIYISSPSIYVNHKNRLNITEETALFPPVNAYSWSKQRAEKIVRYSGLPHIILRPRALVGRGDTIIFPRLIRAHLGGKLKIMGNGTNICDITGVMNMAHAIYCSLKAEDKSALNQDYNITNDEPIKLWTTINKVLTELGYDEVKGRISKRAAYTIAFVLESISRLTTSKEPVLLRYSVSTLSCSMTFDITKAKKRLNYAPLLSTDESIEEFINWYKSLKS